MDTGNVSPASPDRRATPRYSRAACLLNIIAAASMQLREDADGLEQEPLALASRLLSIRNSVNVINGNDKLLRG